MPALASERAAPNPSSSAAGQAAELMRRWSMARAGVDAPPRFEDLMLDGLGAIDDRVVLLARAGADWEIRRLGCAVAEGLGGGGRETRLSELAPDCGFALERAADRAIADGEPRQREAFFARHGHAQRYDILALPLANRWGSPLVAIHLAERGQRYNLIDALFHASDDGVMAFAVVHDEARRPADFQVVDLNAAAAKLLGAPAEGLRWRRLSEDGLSLAAEPLAERLRQLIATGGARERFELTLQGEAAARIVGVNLTRMDDLFCATLTDITEFKQREESYRLLFAANPMPMWIVEARTRRLLAVNDAAIEHYGYSRDRFLAMSADELRLDDAEVEETFVEADAHAGQHERHRRADGEPIDALVFARAITYAGVPAELTAIADITERRRAAAEAAYLARHDALTGLSNRADFNARLTSAIEDGRQGGRRLAICCVDLDLFKDVNDTYGHATGDRLLRLVAQRLRETLGERDFAARLGGDEFAVVLDAVASLDAIEATAARMVEALSAPYPIDGIDVKIGASVGIALFPADGASADELTKNADLALYQAKSDGGWRHRFFQQDLQRAALERRELEADLRDALAERQLEVHYQPLVDISGRRVTGFEALLRWRHPTRGMIAPNDFIPIAEANGLIVPIGEWVLRTACADAAKWPDEIAVAVNLSAIQFRVANLTQTVISVLAQSGLAANRLELEITESVLLADTAATAATLQTLRRFGVRIALDDFGAGYSGLNYLRALPLDKIKIDRSFVKDIAERRHCTAIVAAISTLARDLGIATTAEGVETAEQLDLLRSQGCTQAQGFLFSPARPNADLAALLGRINGGEVAAA
jgi:diguanylate cyclase (GGDEF)-like protein/PAS domain S-box-containing protein